MMDWYKSKLFINLYKFNKVKYNTYRVSIQTLFSMKVNLKFVINNGTLARNIWTLSNYYMKALEISNLS